MLSKGLPKRQEPNTIRLMLTCIQGIRVYTALSHTLTDSISSTAEETETQSCLDDFPSFTQLISQGQNLWLLTPSPKIFLECVHLENLSL